MTLKPKLNDIEAISRRNFLPNFIKIFPKLRPGSSGHQKGTNRQTDRHTHRQTYLQTDTTDCHTSKKKFFYFKVIIMEMLQFNHWLHWHNLKKRLPNESKTVPKQFSEKPKRNNKEGIAVIFSIRRYLTCCWWCKQNVLRGRKCDAATYQLQGVNLATNMYFLQVDIFDWTLTGDLNPIQVVLVRHLT